MDEEGNEIVIEIDNKRDMWQPTVFLMRRLIFVLTVYFLGDKVLYSLFIFMFTQLVWMGYNITVRPDHKKQGDRGHRIEVLNDLTIILSLYCVVMFSDLIPEAIVRDRAGWFLLAI
jgi:hypothetical protein